MRHCASARFRVRLQAAGVTSLQQAGDVLDGAAGGAQRAHDVRAGAVDGLDVDVLLRPRNRRTNLPSVVSAHTLKLLTRTRLPWPVAPYHRHEWA